MNLYLTFADRNTTTVETNPLLPMSQLPFSSDLYSTSHEFKTSQSESAESPIFCPSKKGVAYLRSMSGHFETLIGQITGHFQYKSTQYGYLRMQIWILYPYICHLYPHRLATPHLAQGSPNNRHLVLDDSSTLIG